MERNIDTYKAKYAGSWYPDNKEELKALLEEFMSDVSMPETPPALGIVAPHAGYTYSGSTAAYGFKAIKNNDFDTAVLLAPSHRSFLNNISIMNFSSISTPLGSIEVDIELNQKLLEASSLYSDTPETYIGEHSFELELPLLQYVTKNKNYKLLSLIVGELTLEEFEKASEILRKFLKDRKPIFIASSDFTHFGASFGFQPFADNIPENIKRLDYEAISYIEGMILKHYLSSLKGLKQLFVVEIQ